MRIQVTHEYIKLDTVNIKKIKMTFTSAGIIILPYGFAQKFNEIDVEIEEGYIYDKRVIALFEDRGLMGQEIDLIGPVCKDATFIYMIMCPAVNSTCENEILTKYPQGAFYRANLTKYSY